MDSIMYVPVGIFNIEEEIMNLRSRDDIREVGVWQEENDASTVLIYKFSKQIKLFLKKVIYYNTFSLVL